MCRKKTKCQHVLPYGSLAAVRGKIDSAGEILAEGCPECEVIRGYDTTSEEELIAFEDVKPHAMCAGPPGTLLVCDQKTNKLIQLDFNQNKFQEKALPFSVLADTVQDMCYSRDNQLLVLAHSKFQSITMLNMTTGEVVRRIKTPSDLGLFNRHLCTGPFGTIFVTNGQRVLQLHDSKRLIYETKCCISGTAASFPHDDGECKLAIRCTTPDSRVHVDITRLPTEGRKIFVVPRTHQN